MSNRDDTVEKAVKLRWRAEEIARREGAPSPEELESLSPEEMRQTIHELRVHQIELQMQNEELRRAQAFLDAARARYFDLYDLAPVGYCILSLEGRILEANLTAVTLLGVTRAELVQQPITRFLFKEDQDIYYLHRRHYLETGELSGCELRMVKKDGTAFWVRLTTSASQAPSSSSGQDTDGAPLSRVVLSDITERKQVEEEKAKLEAELQRTRKHHPTVPKTGRGGSGTNAAGN